MRYVISALAVGILLAVALRDDVSRAIVAFWQGEPVGLTVSVPFKRFEFTFGNSPENLSWSRSHSDLDYSQCGRPPTDQVENTAPQTVYKWVDETGQVHLGDSSHVEGVDDLVAIEFPSEKKYFQLEVTGNLYRISPRRLTLLNTEIQKIYEQIAVMLSGELLKKVFVDIRLVESDTELKGFARSVGTNGGGSSGVYIRARNQAVVVRKPKPKDTLDVIHHESVHIILAGLIGKVPKWLNEGLAEYFEPMEIQGQAIHIDFREEWQKQLEWHYPGGIDVLQRNWNNWIRHGAHYAQSL